MKTVSLELSKQLKEAGYPQKDSDFTWSGDKLFPAVKGVEFTEDTAAPTADEILDQLPSTIEEVEIDGDNYGMCELAIWKEEKDYSVNYLDEDSYPELQETEDVLADAAAKMWLYLKKQKLV